MLRYLRDKPPSEWDTVLTTGKQSLPASYGISNRWEVVFLADKSSLSISAHIAYKAMLSSYLIPCAPFSSFPSGWDHLPLSFRHVRDSLPHDRRTHGRTDEAVQPSRPEPAVEVWVVERGIKTLPGKLKWPSVTFVQLLHWWAFPLPTTSSLSVFALDRTGNGKQKGLENVTLSHRFALLIAWMSAELLRISILFEPFKKTTTKKTVLFKCLCNNNGGHYKPGISCYRVDWHKNQED